MGSGRDKRKKAKGAQGGQGGIKTAKKTERNDAKAVRRAEKRAEVFQSLTQGQSIRNTSFAMSMYLDAGLSESLPQEPR